jgi:hypothetical protein
MIKNTPQAAEIIRLYAEEGMHCPAIGKTLGLHPAAVYAFLKRSGIKMRSRSEARSLCNPKGKDHPSWRGGLRPDGYAVRSSKGKNFLAHREAAESFLGRPLTQKEVVHHANEIRSDNSSHNLWVFACQADHAKFHKDGTVAMTVVFPAAERVLGYGFPFNHSWRLK